MRKESSVWPARLDVVQGVTGFILVVFMWAHMFFVSSILISHDAMYWVTKMFEGQPLLGKSYPILVSLVALIIFSLIAIHAWLALRKFPANYQQQKQLWRHMRALNHPDTWLWYIQVITGFALFFLASVHLYQLMLHPADIGPYASSDRVWSGRMWPLYLVLLFAVELHAGIGIYRLAIKWGFMLGKNPQQGRQRLHKAKWLLTFFFLALGIATLGAYIKIGIDHQDQRGERYLPTYISAPLNAPTNKE